MPTMKRYKMAVTRPEFLRMLMSCSADRDCDMDTMTLADMVSPVYEMSSMTYCVYTALMEANINADMVRGIHSDGESIAIAFSNKKTAKEIMGKCKVDSCVRYGSHNYRVKMKTSSNYLIVTVSETESCDE